MLLKGNHKVKKYNIIIIPERGGSTKRLDLSSILIKGTLIFFLTVGVSVAAVTSIFVNRYDRLSEESRSLKHKNEYIRNLEQDNKDKEDVIQNYKVYQDTIQHKIEKIDELEKDIKNKLDQSDFFKDTAQFKDMTQTETAPTLELMGYLEDSQMSVEVIDSKIAALTQINKQLDKVLEKEQYIPSLPPCKGRITSYFGERPNPFNFRGQENHSAIDIANAYGTKIHATAKGRVVYSEYRAGFGNAVYIDHGNGFTSLYGHASKLLVKEGQVVEKGEVIALMGSTGRSTGTHVHFELRKNEVPIDPIKIFE